MGLKHKILRYICWALEKMCSLTHPGEELRASTEYAYKTITEYEGIGGFKVNPDFETGWVMARTTMGDLKQLAENSGGEMVDDENS